MTFEGNHLTKKAAKGFHLYERNSRENLATFVRKIKVQFLA